MKIVNRQSSIIVIMLFMLLLPSCGGKKKIKPPSPEANIAKEAFKLAERIKDAYLRKDKTALKSLCTQNGYLTLIGSIKDFDSADIKFTPKWVDIESDRVILYEKWDGTWLLSGKEFREKGLAAFVLKGSPLKLDDILRANPFRQPEL